MTEENKPIKDIQQLWTFSNDRFALKSDAIGSASMPPEGKTAIDNIIYFTASDNETARGTVTINSATDTIAGLMSAADKKKLNGLDDIKDKVVSDVKINRINNNIADGFNISVIKGFDPDQTSNYIIPLADYSTAGLMTPRDKDRLYNKTGVIDGLYIGNVFSDVKSVVINNKELAIGLEYSKRTNKRPPEIILKDLYGMAKSNIDVSDFLADYYIEHNLKNIELDSDTDELIFRWNALGGGVKITKVPFIGDVGGGSGSGPATTQKLGTIKVGDVTDILPEDGFKVNRVSSKVKEYSDVAYVKIPSISEEDVKELYEKYQFQIPIIIYIRGFNCGSPIEINPPATTTAEPAPESKPEEKPKEPAKPKYQYNNIFVGTSPSSVGVYCELMDSDPYAQKYLKEVKELYFPCYCSLKYNFIKNDGIGLYDEFPNDSSQDPIESIDLTDLIFKKYVKGDKYYNEKIPGFRFSVPYNGELAPVDSIPDLKGCITINALAKDVSIIENPTESYTGSILIHGSSLGINEINKYATHIKDFNKVQVYPYICLHNPGSKFKIIEKHSTYAEIDLRVTKVVPPKPENPEENPTDPKK